MNFRDALFPWVIAAVTGLDYFDNAIFSFFVGDIAGGINASPDELVWSSSTYAVAAVLGILQQQWWVERLGYRRYLSGCLLLYAAAAVLAAASDSSVSLAVARGFQGYFIGPMMGACRILIQASFTAQRRPYATRAFLILILSSSALAPLIGGVLLADFDWRALFACTAPAGVLLALVVLVVVPHSGQLQPQERGDSHLWPYIVFALAQGALQVVLQQVRYELLGSSPGLLLLAAAGVASLAWFVWHQWHEPRPLVRLHALREPTYQAGIGLYVAYYFIASALSYLVSRLLEEGLGYPVENAGWFVGLTSLAAVPMVFVYFRYSARITRKKWIIVPGFALAALVAGWLALMPPGVSMAWLATPLVLRGLLLLFIALPVANVTFRPFALEEFNHGYRFKNIVKQLTYSFSTASLIILEQHRLALHRTRLVEAVTPLNPMFQDAVGALGGPGPDGTGSALVLAELDRLVNQQASFMSSMDGFRFVMVVAVCAGLLAAWQRRID